MNFVDIDKEKQLCPANLTSILDRHSEVYKKHQKNNFDLLWRDGHWGPRKYRNVFNKRLADVPFKCFGVVRNSWDRVASAYFHVTNLKIPNGNAHKLQNKLNKFKDFNDFCRNIDSDSAFSKGHFAPQLNFYRAGIVPTFFIHMDSISTEVPLLMERITGKFLDWGDTHINASPRPYKDYKKIYNASSKKIIEEKYSSDIEAFGFEF